MALLIAATAQALPRHTILAVPANTWNQADRVQRLRLKTFFRRFADPKASRAIGTNRHVHTATGKEVLLCVFWTEHLIGKNGEPITRAKITAIRETLADVNIRIALTDDVGGWIKARGLVAFADTSTSTTTTASTTTTTTVRQQ